ncbi:hypothetical protein EYR36_003538 [Pleurotus pulmonarius]|nr:hypothetical protein EYR36_003535 [Pleurotus pulmonarius]KAF4563099.1 hypothetical protein EYR36_003538 [Pleurotus pulmonarius]
MATYSNHLLSSLARPVHYKLRSQRRQRQLAILRSLSYARKVVELHVGYDSHFTPKYTEGLIDQKVCFKFELISVAYSQRRDAQWIANEGSEASRYRFVHNIIYTQKLARRSLDPNTNQTLIDGTPVLVLTPALSSPPSAPSFTLLLTTKPAPTRFFVNVIPALL